MRTRARLVPLLLGLLVSVGMFVRAFYTAGELTSLAPHFDGTCEPVRGMPGAEDLTFHPVLGYAYVSSDDRRASRAGHPKQGGIYRFDPRDGSKVLLTAAFAGPLHPHGISLFVDADGKQTLFAINHPRMGTSQIEQFEVAADGQLRHRKTLRHPALVSANDLVAVDAERFYVTNDHGRPFGAQQLAEDVLQLVVSRRFGTGNVVYFDGARFRTVVRDASYANGIQLSRDGKTIYLAETLGKTVSFFARDRSSGELRLSRVLPVDSCPDNIELDREGDLWIGAHPKALTFLGHAFDAQERAPSQVLRVSLAGAAPRVAEVYLSTGVPLSAVATAAARDGRLLLGPVFDAELLNCRFR